MNDKKKALKLSNKIKKRVRKLYPEPNIDVVYVLMLLSVSLAKIMNVHQNDVMTLFAGIFKERYPEVTVIQQPMVTKGAPN